jgi:hypothetical protein
MRFRIPIALIAAVGALFAVGASAYAFECYNANRSDQGNASAAKSAALVSPQEFLSEEVGLCPAGVDHVLAILELEGFGTDFLINSHTLMAGGLEKSGHEDKLHDGQGIDHLSQEFFELADGLIGEGFAICEGG